MWRQVQGSGRRSSSPMLAKKGSKTGHVLAPARPQLGRPMPCEHSKWRIGKGMGGQRIRPASWCSRRGASKITGEQSELRCFGCSIHRSSKKGYSPKFAKNSLLRVRLQKWAPGRPKSGRLAVAPTPGPAVHWRRGGRCYSLPTFLKYRARPLSLAALLATSGRGPRCGARNSSLA